MTSSQKEKIFNSIYQQWVQPLYRYAYYQTKDQQSAEDLVQEAFTKYWHKMSTITPGKEKSYLYTSIKNLWLNKVDHQKVVMRFESAAKRTSQVQSPEYIMEMKEFKAKLNTAISSLPKGQREVFLMNRIDGLKYREIAERLGISQKAVEKRMSQALLQLRKIHRKI